MRRSEEVSQLVFKHGAWWRGTMVSVKPRTAASEGLSRKRAKRNHVTYRSTMCERIRS